MSQMCPRMYAWVSDVTNAPHNTRVYGLWLAIKEPEYTLGFRMSQVRLRILASGMVTRENSSTSRYRGCVKADTQGLQATPSQYLASVRWHDVRRELRWEVRHRAGCDGLPACRSRQEGPALTSDDSCRGLWAGEGQCSPSDQPGTSPPTSSSPSQTASRRLQNKPIT